MRYLIGFLYAIYESFFILIKKVKNILLLNGDVI